MSIFQLRTLHNIRKNVEQAHLLTVLLSLFLNTKDRHFLSPLHCTSPDDLETGLRIMAIFHLRTVHNTRKNVAQFYCFLSLTRWLDIFFRQFHCTSPDDSSLEPHVLSTSILCGFVSTLSLQIFSCNFISSWLSTTSVIVHVQAIVFNKFREGISNYYAVRTLATAYRPEHKIIFLYQM